MKSKVILFYLIQMIIFSCGINNRSENKKHLVSNDSLIKNIENPIIITKDSFSINNDTLAYSIEFNYESHKYKFVSHYRKQNISKEEKDIRNPPRIYQKLFISFSNKEVELDIPSYVKREKLINGEEISIVDVRIDLIAFYEVNNQKLLYLSGSGGCMDCNGFEGLFSLNGEKIDILYYNKKFVIEHFHTKDDKFNEIDLTKLPINALFKASLDFQEVEDF